MFNTCMRNFGHRFPNRSPSRARRAGCSPVPAAHTEPLECRALLSAGQLDTSFGGGDGIVSHPEAGINIFPIALAATPDGKLVALGSDDNPNGSNDFLVARYNADGTLDTSFGSGGYQTTDFAGNRDDPADVIVQADGKIVVAGRTGPVVGGGHGLLALARYHVDGSLDSTFDGDGRATVDVAPAAGSAAAIALAAAPGGKLAVLGFTFDPGPGGGERVVVRLNPDGSRDATFDGDGVATGPVSGPTSPSALTFGVAPDGKVVIAGVTQFDPNPVGTSGSMALTRLNADGSLDTTFSGDGNATLHDPDPTITDYPEGIVFVGGKIVVGYGTEANVGPDPFNVGAVRLNDDGTVDTTFGAGGYRTVVTPGTNDASGFVMQPDGKFVIGVAGNSLTPDDRNRVVRLTSDGSIDTTFGGGDGVAELEYNAAYHGSLIDTVVEPSGRIVTLAFGHTGEESRFALAALTPDGQPDAGFHFTNAPSDPVGFTGAFRDTVVLPGGRILAVGVTSDGAYLARLNADGSFDTTFSGDGKVIANLGAGAAFNRVALQSDGKILAFGTVLARFNADGSLDTSFGGGAGFVAPSAAGDGLALQPDGKILTDEGNSRDGARVARYNPDGSLDTTFGSGGRASFNFPIGSAPWKEDGGPYDGFVPLDVAWQASSGKIVVGGQTPGFGTTTDFAAVRLNTDGTLDTSFANGLGMVSADTHDIDFGGRIDVAPDGAIAMAAEEEDEDPNLVLFDNDGNWAKFKRLPWGGDTSDVSFTADGRIVITGDADGTDPDTDLPNRDIHVIRLNRDLTIDATFGSATGVRTDVFGSSEDFPYGIAIAPNGDVLVAGTASSSPVLLRYDGGGLAPTAVTNTFLGSSAWSASFLRYMDRIFGDDRFGYAMGAPADGATPAPAGQPTAPLPWLNLDTISIQFNRPVSVAAGDLHVRGVSVADYGIKSFHYDQATRTGVWTLDQPIGADKVLLQLDNVEEIGGSFRSRFDVLPGDVNQDGAVLADDFSDVKKRFFTGADDTGFSENPYSAFHDVDGSGKILANDYSELKKRFFTRLPAGAPTPMTASVAAAATPAAGRRASAARSLFSSAPVLA